MTRTIYWIFIHGLALIGLAAVIWAVVGLTLLALGFHVPGEPERQWFAPNPRAWFIT